MTMTLNQAKSFEAKFKSEAIDQGIHGTGKDIIIDKAFEKYLSRVKLSDSVWFEMKTSRPLDHIHFRLRGI
ncbi:MAG: hypothetical protein R6U50_04200 [Desulfobacterales bacterium]